MLIEAHKIRYGDVLITSVHTDGAKVKEIWRNDDSSIRVVYDSGKFEWFDSKALVVRRNEDD